MDAQFITEGVLNNIIRAYNGTKHSQFRYSADNRGYAREVALAASSTVDASTQMRWLAEEHAAGRVSPSFKEVCRQAKVLLLANDGKPMNTPPNNTTANTVAANTVAANTVEPTKEDKNVVGNQEGLQLLAEVMANTIKGLNLNELKDEAEKTLIERVEKYIHEQYGPITKKTTLIINNNEPVQLSGVVHEKFTDVLSYVALNEPVFLAGPAGSGKNHLCKQVAEALGLDFYFTNAVTQEYKLTGFTDATGNFHETSFYKAFKNGGLFMLDEMDASIPEVLNILNAAIANRYHDFPAPIGYVEAHPDFRVIAAGNTTGHGADYDYVGRMQLDAATLDRFGLMRIDYDPRIEEAMAQGDTDLLGFCRAFRRACQSNGIRSIVSYRAINRMAKLKDLLKSKDLVESCLVKGLEKGDIQMIRSSVQGFGEYSEALNALCH